MIQTDTYIKKQPVADYSTPVIDIKGLYKSFEKKTDILKGVDLTVKKGENLVVLGKSGSGKSVFVVSIITGLLFKHSPKTLRLILVDPKQVDLAAFAHVPHLLMPPIREPRKAVIALKWANPSFINSVPICRN